MPNKRGFTLIELMIVVAVIGILSGVLISVINPEQQKAMAQDSVIRKDVNGAAISIESYMAAEGSYPEEGAVNNPLDSSAATSSIAAVYLNSWPEGLVYNVNGDEFSVHAKKATNDDFFKYNNDWKELRECAETTDENDIADCD